MRAWRTTKNQSQTHTHTHTHTHTTHRARRIILPRLQARAQPITSAIFAHYSSLYRIPCFFAITTHARKRTTPRSNAYAPAPTRTHHPHLLPEIVECRLLAPQQPLARFPLRDRRHFLHHIFCGALRIRKEVETTMKIRLKTFDALTFISLNVSP